MDYPESESSTMEFKERVRARDQVLKTVVGLKTSKTASLAEPLGKVHTY